MSSVCSFQTKYSRQSSRSERPPSGKYYDQHHQQQNHEGAYGKNKKEQQQQSQQNSQFDKDKFYENEKKHKQIMLENKKRRQEKERKLKEQEEKKKQKEQLLLEERKKDQKSAYLKYLRNNQSQNMLQQFKNENKLNVQNNKLQNQKPQSAKTQYPRQKQQQQQLQQQQNKTYYPQSQQQKQKQQQSDKQLEDFLNNESMIPGLDLEIKEQNFEKIQKIYKKNHQKNYIQDFEIEQNHENEFLDNKSKVIEGLDLTSSSVWKGPKVIKEKPLTAMTQSQNKSKLGKSLQKHIQAGKSIDEKLNDIYFNQQNEEIEELIGFQDSNPDENLQNSLNQSSTTYKNKVIQSKNLVRINSAKEKQPQSQQQYQQISGLTSENLEKHKQNFKKKPQNSQEEYKYWANQEEKKAEDLFSEISCRPSLMSAGSKRNSQQLQPLKRSNTNNQQQNLQQQKQQQQQQRNDRSKSNNTKKIPTYTKPNFKNSSKVRESSSELKKFKKQAKTHINSDQNIDQISIANSSTTTTSKFKRRIQQDISQVSIQQDQNKSNIKPPLSKNQRQKPNNNNVQRREYSPQTTCTRDEDIDIEEFIKDDLKNINKEEQDLQKEIIDIHQQNQDKVRQVECKNNVQINYKNSKQLLDGIIPSQNPQQQQQQQYQQSQVYDEDMLQESIVRLDQMLAKKGGKNILQNPSQQQSFTTYNNMYNNNNPNQQQMQSQTSYNTMYQPQPQFQQPQQQPFLQQQQQQQQQQLQQQQIPIMPIQQQNFPSMPRFDKTLTNVDIFQEQLSLSQQQLQQQQLSLSQQQQQQQQQQLQQQQNQYPNFMNPSQQTPQFSQNNPNQPLQSQQLQQMQINYLQQQQQNQQTFQQQQNQPPQSITYTKEEYEFNDIDDESPQKPQQNQNKQQQQYDLEQQRQEAKIEQELDDIFQKKQIKKIDDDISEIQKIENQHEIKSLQGSTYFVNQVDTSQRPGSDYQQIRGGPPQNNLNETNRSNLSKPGVGGKFARKIQKYQQQNPQNSRNDTSVADSEFGLSKVSECKSIASHHKYSKPQQQPQTQTQQKQSGYGQKSKQQPQQSQQIQEIAETSLENEEGEKIGKIVTNNKLTQLLFD